ncbi:PAS domain S-box protein [Halovivax limisalsi]|uniref:PAS domain S-box protein n=1 Tax=Halovivax limisalsi TaxID=1453760 RepID=UPI001FFD7653|nr:PAS domain S-box protein [Halovivax limisalsi]
MNTRPGATDEPFWGAVDDEVALDRYRTLVNTIDDGLYQLDAEGRFVAVNDVVVETTGYAREELVGEHVSILLTDEDVTRIAREITRQLDAEDGPISTFELGIQTADGGTVPCELRVNLLIDSGEFAGTIGVVRDISEKTQRLATLESAQASYDSMTNVLDEANIGVFVLDETFSVAWVDETIEEYFGLERESLIGRDKRRLVRERITDRVADPDAFAERVLATYDDNSYIEEFECRVTPGPNREGRWLEHRSKPIESGQYAGGRIELYYDITERKASEGALEESEDRFQSLVDAVEGYAIYRLDTDGRVISWNEGAKEIVGHEAPAILGEHVSTFYTDADRETGVPRRNLRRAIETGSVEVEGWRRTADGGRFRADETITAIRDDAGTHRGYLIVARDTTERYERERELESELERVFGRISDAFFAVDEAFRFTHVNERAETLLQRSADELIDESLWEVFPEASEMAAVREAFDTALTDQAVTSYELYHEELGIWVEANLYPSETGISVYFRDVTDRTERERELERYETIVETVDDGIYAVDADGHFVLVNEAFCAMTGYRRDELLGSHATIVHEEDVTTQAEAAVADIVAGDREVGKIDLNLQPKADEAFPAESRIAPFPIGDEHGRCGVVRDISERVARERALEKSERRYRTLVENFPNGAVGLFDEEYTYSVVGGELLDEVGRDPDEVVGERVIDRYPDATADRIEPYLRAVFEGESNSFDLEFGDRHLNAHALPVHDADGDIYAGMLVVQDVTERTEYRRRLESSNERLETFAYAASHDLQEPLRMVTSYLQLLERRYGDELGADGREFLEFAVDGAERMREMIDGLLEYSRVETRGDPFEPIDLNDVLEDVRRDLEVRIAESDAEISAERLPRVRGDASQLRQVFQNLLENAIAYSGDEPPTIEISAERDGDDWIVSVRDDGIGIDPDDQERIFDVFQRLHTHDEHPGTGIGLALTRRIVERHGGEIRVESDPGEGATFSFGLPAADDEGRSRDRE